MLDYENDMLRRGASLRSLKYELAMETDGRKCNELREQIRKERQELIDTVEAHR